ncbi:hypothetical protein IJI86_00535 [Candidatus Saccharibacteria bacterium]|nr:hypothetical protein [Candidatus Saccharibacteria bacterium]
MKKLSILTTPAIALGVGVLCAPQALAVGYTLNQTNVDAAVAAAGHNTEGIFCDDGGGQFCTLNEGDWTQEGDVAMPVIDDSLTPAMRWGLVLQNDVNISNPDGGTITGDVAITADEVTLTDVNLTGSVTIDNANAEVTIDGGSYTGEGWGAALNINNVNTVTINNATFTAGEASAAYIGGGDITITGNSSFASDDDFGILVFGGLNSLNIASGTFSGARGGLAFEGGIPDGSTVSLSGGTFTGTGANGRAITVDNTDDTAVISGMLASGYHFTNGTIETDTQPGMGGGDYVYIAGTTTVTDGSDEDSSDSDSTSKSGLGAPDTGVFTAEGGSAEDTTAIIAILAVLAAAGLYLRRRVLR